jgi:hypothetical protein
MQVFIFFILVIYIIGWYVATIASWEHVKECKKCQEFLSTNIDEHAILSLFWPLWLISWLWNDRKKCI